MCPAHRRRARLGQDMSIPIKRRRKPAAACAVEGCEVPYDSNGYCSMHYRRWKKHDDPLAGGRSGSLGYSNAHHRVRQERGRAINQVCEHCGGTAAEWAYNHNDPHEKLEYREGCTFPCEYSESPEFYVPLCASCHRTFDFEWRLKHGQYRKLWAHMECPTCHQPPGRRCRTRNSGQPCDTHRTRRRLEVADG